MVIRDTVDDGHRDCIEKHDVNSENRDESKFTEFPERSDGSKFPKSHHEHRDGSKVVTKIEMGEQNSDGRRDELVDGSENGAREHERIHGEVSDESKVETR